MLPHRGSWPWGCSPDDRERPTIEHWIPALRRQWHVDEAAIEKLKRLLQWSIAGYEQAMSLIAKIIKAASDNNVIDHRLAFIMTGVQHRWKTIGHP